MPIWSFITNHGAILATIAKNPTLTAREIAIRLGITEGSVRRIIGDLEAGGYLKRMKNGRNNEYEVNHELPLPWPEDRAVPVGELLRVLNSPDEEESPLD